MTGALKRNFIWSAAGLAFPLVVAALSIPSTIDRIGAEKFGLLALAWGLIGYAGLLDLGVGRALTKRVASLRVDNNFVEIARVFRTAVQVTWLAGLVGAVALLAAVAFDIDRLIELSAVGRDEVVWSIALVAVALPAQAVSATYRGVNEAYGNFGAISVLRMLLGAVNFGGPLLVTYLSTELTWLIATIVLSRIVALFFFRRFALDCLSVDIKGVRNGVDTRVAVDLLKFGGWFTVSNILSPVMVQADRFAIGALISATAVAHYVLPYEIAVQSLILVSALTAVLFPMLSATLAVSSEQAYQLYRQWLFRVTGVMFFLMLSLGLAFPWILDTWLGERVPDESELIGQILCIGVLVNSIGAICFSYLHAHGHARATAIAHLIELPIFLIVLYVGVSVFGVIGAACAWVIRVSLDTLILLFLSSRLKGK